MWCIWLAGRSVAAWSTLTSVLLTPNHRTVGGAAIAQLEFTSASLAWGVAGSGPRAFCAPGSCLESHHQISASSPCFHPTRYSTFHVGVHARGLLHGGVPWTLSWTHCRDLHRIEVIASNMINHTTIVDLLFASACVSQFDDHECNDKGFSEGTACWADRQCRSPARRCLQRRNSAQSSPKPTRQFQGCRGYASRVHLRDVFPGLSLSAALIESEWLIVSL